MAEKTFAIRVAFGDGHPIDDRIKAKSGLHAQDVARFKYPTARNIYITTAKPRHVPVEPAIVQPELFEEVEPEVDVDQLRQEYIQKCLTMRRDGLSHQAIACSLGVAKSTIGRWLKQYG
jgi:hypothetical protein